MDLARGSKGRPFNAGFTAIHVDFLQVEQDMMNDPSVDHEYIPIDGTKAFTEAASKLILGQGSVALRENRVYVNIHT